MAYDSGQPRRCSTTSRSRPSARPRARALGEAYEQLDDRTADRSRQLFGRAEGYGGAAHARRFAALGCRARSRRVGGRRRAACAASSRRDRRRPSRRRIASCRTRCARSRSATPSCAPGCRSRGSSPTCPHTHGRSSGCSALAGRGCSSGTARRRARTRTSDGGVTSACRRPAAARSRARSVARTSHGAVAQDERAVGQPSTRAWRRGRRGAPRAGGRSPRALAVSAQARRSGRSRRGGRARRPVAGGERGRLVEEEQLGEACPAAAARRAASP